MSIKIFWNHIGREHGIDTYPEDIRKNSDEIKQQAIARKMNSTHFNHTYVKHDENTLVELAPEHANYKFIIIYFIKEGLQFSLHYKPRYNWWLIDIMEVEELKPGIFCIHDLFLDIAVEEDGTYKVLDEDEFAFAVENDIITKAQQERAITSFTSIIQQLEAKQFPRERLEEIARVYGVL